MQWLSGEEGQGGWSRADKITQTRSLWQLIIAQDLDHLIRSGASLIIKKSINSVFTASVLLHFIALLFINNRFSLFTIACQFCSLIIIFTFQVVSISFTEQNYLLVYRNFVHDTFLLQLDYSSKVSMSYNSSTLNFVRFLLV